MPKGNPHKMDPKYLSRKVRRTLAAEAKELADMEISDLKHLHSTDMIPAVMTQTEVKEIVSAEVVPVIMSQSEAGVATGCCCCHQEKFFQEGVSEEADHTGCNACCSCSHHGHLGEAAGKHDPYSCYSCCKRAISSSDQV